MICNKIGSKNVLCFDHYRHCRFRIALKSNTKFFRQRAILTSREEHRR